MSNIFCVTIEHSTHSSRCPPHCSDVSMDPASPQPAVETLRRYCPARTLATCWELLFALFSSAILTAYTLHHEARSNYHRDSGLQVQAFDPGHLGFILDPSPTLMLLFCVVLGCSVSSFYYRHQERDKIQAPLFILILTAVTIFSFGLGVNVNLIMLGIVPWALCFSMGLSTTVHWIVRRCRKRWSHFVYGIDEKEALIRRLGCKCRIERRG